MTLSQPNLLAHYDFTPWQGQLPIATDAAKQQEPETRGNMVKPSPFQIDR